MFKNNSNHINFCHVRGVQKELNLDFDPETAFKTAIDFSIKSRDCYTTVPALYELGILYLSQNNKDVGINHIKESLDKANFYHLLQEQIYIKNVLKKIS